MGQEQSQTKISSNQTVTPIQTPSRSPSPPQPSKVQSVPPTTSSSTTTTATTSNQSSWWNSLSSWGSPNGPPTLAAPAKSKANDVKTKSCSTPEKKKADSIYESIPSINGQLPPPPPTVK